MNTERLFFKTLYGLILQSNLQKQGTFKESSWIFYVQKARVIHSSSMYLCLVGWNPFLHFSCLWQSFIDRGNDIQGQFIILHEFFDFLLEAGLIKNLVAQETNWKLRL